MARPFLGRAIYWTGVYFVDGLLIESGPPNLARDVRTLAGELRVRQCVTTHNHEDHSGNNGVLASELRITPLAHRFAVARLAQPEAHPQLYRRVAWGARPAARVEPLSDRLDTPSFQFKVIHTPGHAADHVALSGRCRGTISRGASGPVEIFPNGTSCEGSYGTAPEATSRSRVTRCENTRQPTNNKISVHTITL